jgi:hypothetical protein
MPLNWPSWVEILFSGKSLKWDLTLGLSSPFIKLSAGNVVLDWA